jgi:hypothetical protein
MACVPASAQTGPYRPERPYRGIFGSGVDALGQSLTANGALSAGYDDDLLADATNSSGIQSGQGGKLAQVSGGLNYDLTSNRAQFSAGVGGSVRYYPSFENDYLNTYNAGVMGQVRVLDDKPTLTLRQSVDYSPYSFASSYSGHQTDPFAITPVAPPDLDFVPLASQYFNAESRASLDARVSRKLSVYSSYSYRVSARDTTDSWYQSGDAGLKVALSRELGLRMGYRYSQAHYDTRVDETHSPDVGLDFNRALSLTRRTSFTFGVGAEATRSNDQTQYHATGNVHLTHEIGRTWTADAGYQRGTYYVDTINEPVFADSANAGLHGLITRRIQFQALVSAMIGNSSFNTDREFDSYRGSVSVSTALNRFMSVGADYAYYRYLYDEQILLDPGLPYSVNRQSIRAHVSFWAPLMNRTRRPDASR